MNLIFKIENIKGKRERERQTERKVEGESKRFIRRNKNNNSYQKTQGTI